MKIVLLAALCAAIAAPAALAGSNSTALTGTVGPGFTITLKQGSKTVKTLKAGTYTFKISDKSNIHNFHLSGPA